MNSLPHGPRGNLYTAWKAVAPHDNCQEKVEIKTLTQFCLWVTHSGQWLILVTCREHLWVQMEQDCNLYVVVHLLPGAPLTSKRLRPTPGDPCFKTAPASPVPGPVWTWTEASPWP